MKKDEEILQLQKKIDHLTQELATRDKLFFMLDEAIPIEQNARRRYMADIALFHTTIFKAKLQHFISDQLEALAIIGRSQRDEDIIRSNISCFRLIDEWMEKRTNEHLGNLQEIRKRFETDEEFSKEFKNIYLT